MNWKDVDREIAKRIEYRIKFAKRNRKIRKFMERVKVLVSDRSKETDAIHGNVIDAFIEELKDEPYYQFLSSRGYIRSFWLLAVHESAKPSPNNRSFDPNSELGRGFSPSAINILKIKLPLYAQPLNYLRVPSS